MHIGARQRSPITALVVGLAGLSMLAGYLQKARCAGAPFDGVGRSLIFDASRTRQVCYSDIQFLWLGRDINLHVFPYVTGGINADGILTGGTVEYPVLSGMLMWLGGIGSHTDADFLLHSALILAPFGLLTAWMLGTAGRLVGAAVVGHSAAGAVCLPQLGTARGRARRSAAIFVMTLERIPAPRPCGPGGGPPRRRFLPEGVSGDVRASADRLRAHSERHRRAGVYDVRGALMIGGAPRSPPSSSVNLPFALISYEGWRASFTFQENRQADITTNSIWYWGLRPLFGPVADDVPLPAYDQTVSLLSPLLILRVVRARHASRLAAVPTRRHLPVDRRQRRDAVRIPAAAQGAFAAVHAVAHAVLRPAHVPWGIVAAYLVADLSMGIGIFKYFGALAAQTDASTFEVLVKFGVWGRAGLLVVLFFVFLRAAQRHPPVRGRTGPDSGRRPVLKSPEPVR